MSWAGQLRIKRLEVISLFLQIISSRITFKAVLDISKLCVWWMSKKKRWYKAVDKVWSSCHEYEYESAYSGQLSGVVWSDHCDHCDQLTIGIKTSCWALAASERLVIRGEISFWKWRLQRWLSWWWCGPLFWG